MAPIESWITKKALQIAESTLLAALQPEDPQAILLPKMDRALDRLLSAPYADARLALERGDFDKALDNLETATVQQPLHVPARLLYIQLLCRERRFDVALRRIQDLLEAFSYREDLVPAPIYDAFLESVLHTPVRPQASAPLQLRFRGDGYRARSIWCSTSAIAVEWFEHRQGLLSEWDDVAVGIYSWGGTEILEIHADKHHRLEMLTTRYAVYRDENERLVVMDLLTKSQESTLDDETFKAIFLPAGRALASTQLYPLAHFGRNQLDADSAVFSDVALRLGTYSESRDEEALMDVGDFLMPYTTTNIHDGGTVECTPRPLPRMPEGPRSVVPEAVPETVEVGWQGMD